MSEKIAPYLGENRTVPRKKWDRTSEEMGPYLGEKRKIVKKGGLSEEAAFDIS